jgi:hypothetical protein
MSRSNRYTTVSDDLLPTWTTRSHDYERQVDSMREIRELTNAIASSHYRRDQLMAALALSNSLSRQDMARAAGLTKARVDQIIREVAEENVRRMQREGEERVRRHMPHSVGA